MQTQLRENLTTFAEHNIPFGILLIQIDHLDQLRASRGPGILPTILRIVAQSVENFLRPTDLVGCWSENRFIAVLMECKESEVALVGDRVRKMIGSSEIEWWGDKFFVTSSVGGASSRNGDNSERLVARAVASLQKSIGKDGNCVTVLS
jgi:diguanylate cyclase (GGDEF)-like protein